MADAQQKSAHVGLVNSNNLSIMQFTVNALLTESLQCYV